MDRRRNSVSDDGFCSDGSDGGATFEEILDEFSRLPLAAVETRVENIIAYNERLLKENMMFERFAEMHDIRQREEARLTASSRGSTQAQLLAAQKRRQAAKRMQRELTWTQKVEISSSEIVELNKDRTRQRLAFQRHVADIEAQIEEVARCVNDIRLDRILFKRIVKEGDKNVIRGMENFVTAEAIQAYYTAKAESRHELVEKLDTKNERLYKEIRRLRTQLRKKEEMNEDLQKIDFGQLDIENKQYQTKIKERNAELLDLKHIAGRTVHNLNHHKHTLHTKTAHSADLQRKIAAKDATLDKIARERTKVDEKIEQLLAKTERLALQQQEFRVPAVLEYVVENEREHNLLKDLGNWERKVEIAEMALKRQRRQWQETGGGTGGPAADRTTRGGGGSTMRSTRPGGGVVSIGSSVTGLRTGRSAGGTRKAGGKIHRGRPPLYFTGSSRR